MNRINQVLGQDAKFLGQMGLMDYSLLLVVEERTAKGIKATRTLEDPATCHNKILSQDKKLIYHIGVIDYLQNWNYVKRIENLYKTRILQRDPYQIAAIEPKKYARRFTNFLNSKALAINQLEKTIFVTSVLTAPNDSNHPIVNNLDLGVAGDAPALIEDYWSNLETSHAQTSDDAQPSSVVNP